MTWRGFDKMETDYGITGGAGSNFVVALVGSCTGTTLTTSSALGFSFEKSI